VVLKRRSHAIEVMRSADRLRCGFSGGGGWPSRADRAREVIVRVGDAPALPHAVLAGAPHICGLARCGGNELLPVWGSVGF
jgi:hypothetical protein